MATRVTHITTIPLTLGFLSGQPTALRPLGYELHYVSSPEPLLSELASEEGVAAHGVAMTRRITPLRDALALLRLGWLLRRLRPTIVHAHTAKAGLLGMLAATASGVPVRIYHLHGTRWATTRGLKRGLLRAADRLACRLATRVLSVSESVRELAVGEGIVVAERVGVLHNGSINGVDALGHFDPQRYDRDSEKQKLGLDPSDPVVGYVGRIARDKGIAELAEAWRLVREGAPRAKLCLVGQPDPDDPVPNSVWSRLVGDPGVVVLGEQRDPAPAMAAMDVLVLPSYREGFPVVLLEAAALRLPVVATRVTGTVDAVVDGVTGRLVAPCAPERLAEAVLGYLANPEVRRHHGKVARERVLRDYRPDDVVSALAETYRRLRGGTHPAVRSRSKRALDVAASLAALTALAPFAAALAGVVRWRLGAPVLFRQRRPGLDGEPFMLLKLRTMTDERGPDGELLPDAERLTPLGRFLRSTSLDELPTLLNVLRGDMSLVGPRPLLMQYLERYSAEQARRHEVRPGVTGWAQVNGRNALSWDEKFAHDVWYVDHWSLGLDLRIVLKTLGSVLRREGISQPGQATMTEFIGSEATIRPAAAGEAG